MGKRTALIVGINDYEDPSFERLKYAETDAQAVYNVLIDPDICEFEKDNVMLLKGETKSQVERNLEGLLNDAKPDDFVFIYFAGHGKLDRSGSLCLAAKDTLTTRLLSSSVSLEHVRRIIDQSDCKRIVFILDSCFSGAVGQTFRSGEVPTESIEQISGQGKVMISASQAYERARERDDIGHGIFTYNLVKGLTEGEADFGSDGYITIEDIYKYVYENVKAETNGQQVPMKWGVDEKGEIIVAKSVKVLREKRQELERKIKAARDLEKDGKLGEALSAWAEAAVRDPDNEEVAQNKERLKGIITNIDELFVHFDKRGLPGTIYNNAVEILKKPEATLTDREESYRRLTENLLNKSLSLQIFLDSWKRIERADIVIGSKEEGTGDSEKAFFLSEKLEEAPVLYQADFVDESKIVEKKDGETEPPPKPGAGLGAKLVESHKSSMRMVYTVLPVLFVVLIVAFIIFQFVKSESGPGTALPAPEILSFSVSPEKIKIGDSATLKWETKNSFQVAIEDIKPVEPSGEMKVSPEKTATYKLSAQNKEGKIVTRELKVTVEAALLPVKIAHFTAEPKTISKGDSTTLSWDTSNADQVRIEPLGNVKDSGSKKVSPSETASYKLIAENKDGEIAYKVVSVNVISGAALPKINYFSADNNSIEPGQSVLLKWGTSNVKSVEIKPIGEVQSNGTTRVSPEKTTIYTLLALNSEGKSVSENITVKVAAEHSEKLALVKPPRINYFRTNGNNLEKGYPFILSWDTSFAEEVEITDIGRVKNSGYKSLKASETKIYTLIATNKEGKKTESRVTITIVDDAQVEGDLPKIQYEVDPVLPEAVRRHIEKKE